MSRVPGGKSIVGCRFGKWLVLDKDIVKIKRDLFYVCRCDCGLEKLVSKKSLARGSSKSCRGCCKTGRYNDSDNILSANKPHWKTLQFIKKDLEPIYEKHVIKNEIGCWGWKTSLSQGYGAFRCGVNRIRAHKASWIIHFGEIPKGLCVLHKCDNPICSNPMHLFLGTRRDNCLDMISKKR